MTPTLAALIFVSVFCILLLAVTAGAIGIYNQLVKLKNRYLNGFSQIEVQLRRRYDLIPNLVEATKAFLSHERETLEAVIAARNQASNGLAKAAGDPGNTAAMQAFAGAESALMGALGRFSMVIEAYPEIKANETVAQLTEELTSTENKIAFARQAYNDWATNYNNYREVFPNVIFAPWIGHDKNATLLEFVEQPEIHQTPRVSLV